MHSAYMNNGAGNGHNKVTILVSNDHKWMDYWKGLNAPTDHMPAQLQSSGRRRACQPWVEGAWLHVINGGPWKGARYNQTHLWKCVQPTMFVSWSFFQGGYRQDHSAPFPLLSRTGPAACCSWIQREIQLIPSRPFQSCTPVARPPDAYDLFRACKPQTVHLLLHPWCRRTWMYQWAVWYDG